MPFLTPLDLEAVDDTSGRFVLKSPLIYQFGRLNITITVPAGFVTDLASIPQALQAVFPVTQTYLREAVLHDWLYSSQRVPRALADEIFRCAMDEVSSSWWRPWAIWAGVRVGGWVAWNEHAKQNAG